MNIKIPLCTKTMNSESLIDSASVFKSISLRFRLDVDTNSPGKCRIGGARLTDLSSLKRGGPRLRIDLPIYNRNKCVSTCTRAFGEAGTAEPTRPDPETGTSIELSYIVAEALVKRG